MIRLFKGKKAGEGSLVVCFRQLSSSDSADAKKSKESEVDKLVFALKKRDGEGLENSDKSDVDFKIQSQMLKSFSNRFALRFKKKSRDLLLPDDNDPFKSTEKSDEKAPQHRRYLSFPKVTVQGTHAQRRNADDKMRMQRGATVAHKYKMEQLGFQEQESDGRDLSLGGANPVEDKIMLSMLQGDFDNLEGAGLPQKKATNSLIDSTTDIGYNILAKHGIVPDFVQSQKLMNGQKLYLRAWVKLEGIKFVMDAAMGKEERGLEDDEAKDPPLCYAENFCPEESPLYEAFKKEEAILRATTERYNLQCPSMVLTRGALDVAYELTAIRSEIQKMAIERPRPTQSDLGRRREALANEMEANRQLRDMAVEEHQNGGHRGWVKPGTRVTRPSYASGATRAAAWRGGELTPLRVEGEGFGIGTLAINAMLMPLDSFTKWLIKVIDK